MKWIVFERSPTGPYLDLVGHEGGRVGHVEIRVLPVAHLLLAPRLPRDVAPPRHQVVEPGPVVLDLRHFLRQGRTAHCRSQANGGQRTQATCRLYSRTFISFIFVHYNWCSIESRDYYILFIPPSILKLFCIYCVTQQFYNTHQIAESGVDSTLHTRNLKMVTLTDQEMTMLVGSLPFPSTLSGFL